MTYSLRTDQARELVLKTLDGLSTEQKADYGLVKEKGPRRTQAADPENHRPPADDYAGDPRNLSRLGIITTNHESTVLLQQLAAASLCGIQRTEAEVALSRGKC